MNDDKSVALTEEDPADEEQDLGTGVAVTIGDRPPTVTPVTETISNMLTSITDGDVIIQPSYQRRAFWDTKKKVSLIESIFLGLPLPLIYLAEASTQIDGEMYPVREVVDGQQRLTSIQDFYNGNLRIPEESFIKELKGKKYTDLAPTLRAAFKNFKLSTATIPEGARADKFELFKRLNQQSTVLSTQELRNAAYHGPYLDFIKERAKALAEHLRITDAEWKRMKDVEYLTRLLAFQRSGYAAFPNKRLNQFLNYEMKVGNAESLAHASQRCKVVEKALDRVMQVFGERRFRPYRIPEKGYFGEWARTINRALMEAQVWAFSDHSRFGFKDSGSFDRALIDHRAEIVESVMRLHAYDARFSDSIQRGTTGSPNVEYRFSRYVAAVKVALSTVQDGRRRRFFTVQQKQNIWDRLSPDDRACRSCGRPLTFEESEVDHIHPYSKGGETIEDNGQLLHRSCNRAKGARWDPVADELE